MKCSAFDEGRSVTPKDLEISLVWGKTRGK
jgi:hypothetical protein